MRLRTRSTSVLPQCRGAPPRRGQPRGQTLPDLISLPSSQALYWVARTSNTAVGDSRARPKQGRRAHKKACGTSVLDTPINQNTMTSPRRLQETPPIAAREGTIICGFTIMCFHDPMRIHFFPGFARNLSMCISLRDERGRFGFYIDCLVHESVVRAYDTQRLTQNRSKSF